MHSTERPSTKAGVPETARPATVAQCHEVIEAQARQIEWLAQRVVQQDPLLAVLQERLKLDSHNSSKPLSSGGASKPNRAQRRTSSRKRGAQEGQPGAFRALLHEAEVNGVHECHPPPAVRMWRSGGGERQTAAPPSVRHPAGHR